MVEQHRKVLVVDDDVNVRRMLVSALGQRGLLIDEASDGAEAIALLSENRYAVVLLDLMMPVVDGFVVLESIDRSGSPPVVLVVTGADRRVIDQLDSSRIHGIVRKPFDPLDIADIVAACVEIRGRSSFETMAVATLLSSAPLIALLKL
ncbi:MAG: response regulator [Acidobacteriota bacterium]